MSSGNPFRASQLYSQPPSAPVPHPSLVPLDSSVPDIPGRGSDYVSQDPALPPPLKTKKHVRIESSTIYIPPQADDDLANETLRDPHAYQPSQNRYASSPPSVGSASFSAVGTQNDSSRGDHVEGYPMAASDALSSSSPYPDKPQTAFSPSQAPANPFSRTLASLEPPDTGSGEDRTGTERATLANNRMSLDVESFKNLLMTGKPTPRPSAQASHAAAASNPLGGTQFESSSSTDTSSISRQSLFEPPHEVHAETPRTSYEMAESDEEDTVALVSEAKKPKKKPPPAPKHRHGKPVTPRQPQIVSFDSFAATAPTSSPITRPRDNSDVNKPLPPTPVVSTPPLHISTQDITQHQPIPVQPRSADPLASPDPPTPQKRTPPPVPLARRQSQLRASGASNRSRSNSSLTISSQHSMDPPPSPAPSNHDPMATAKSPPPPPRPRNDRSRFANTSTSSANSSTTELPQRSASVRTAPSTSNPSRRSTLDIDFDPSTPGSGIHRSASTTSTSHRPAHRSVSNESTATTNTMPPPPPPPRRSGGRSSLDQPRPYIPAPSPTGSRRTSTENKRASLDSKRRTSAASESSLRYEYAPPGEERRLEEEMGDVEAEVAVVSPLEGVDKRLDVVPQKDGERADSSNILDDMEKFQREIDELRNRFG